MKINIVSVWTWFTNILDTQTLSASEQLILIHVIKILNRNFWKPTKISNSALCRSCGKDARTVKRSLSLLISAGFLKESDEGIFLNLASDDEPKKGRKPKTTTAPLVNSIKPPKKYTPPERNKTPDDIATPIKSDIITNIREGKAFSSALQAIWEGLSPDTQRALDLIARQTELNL